MPISSRRAIGGSRFAQASAFGILLSCVVTLTLVVSAGVPVSFGGERDSASRSIAGSSGNGGVPSTVTLSSLRPVSSATTPEPGGRARERFPSQVDPWANSGTKASDRPGVRLQPVDRVGLIFGGYQNTTPPCPLSSSCVSADTWTLSGGAWTNKTPALPSPTNTPSGRYGASMAYDPALGAFVLFGGSTQMPNGFNNPALGDTWLFAPANDTWFQACQSCTSGTNDSPVRWDAGVVYDPLDSEVVLFGGMTTVSGSTSDLSDTWTFNGTAWNQTSGATVPAARASPSMAWDAQSESVVLFGGVPTSLATGRTWSFSAGAWTMQTALRLSSRDGRGVGRHRPRERFRHDHRRLRHRSVHEGVINQTWSFSNGEWGPGSFRMPTPPRWDGTTRRCSKSGPRTRSPCSGETSGAPANDTWYFFHIEVGEAVRFPGDRRYRAIRRPASERDGRFRVRYLSVDQPANGMCEFERFLHRV